LIGACALLLLKKRPLKKSLTRCFRLVDNFEESLDAINSSTSYSSTNPDSNDSFLIDIKQDNDDNDDDIYMKQISFNSSSSTSLSSSTSPTSISSMTPSFLFASKSTILVSIGLLGIRYGLSALAWDRSVHRYENLFDIESKSILHQVKSQISVL
jgi:hypothetical protein